MKPLPLLLAALALMTLGAASDANKNSASSRPQPVAGGVALPNDPLLNAIEQRFGRPDRLTGSGRAFLQYDLSNGDVVTLVVSGDKIIGLQHDKKRE